MAELDDIVSRIPMSSLADQLGVDQPTAESAVRQALPALLGGLQANAADPAGAASLNGALDQHSPDLVEDGVDLNQVDTGDGQKIVQNVFGANTDQVASALGGQVGGGGGSDLMQRLLPLLAPIVLSYLTSRLRGGGTGQAAGQGGGVGDLLGSLLGGMGGGGLAGGLGSALGGQSSAQAGAQGGGVLDLLGGLLGGGRR